MTRILFDSQQFSKIGLIEKNRFSQPTLRINENHAQEGFEYEPPTKEAGNLFLEMFTNFGRYRRMLKNIDLFLFSWVLTTESKITERKIFCNSMQIFARKNYFQSRL